MSFLWELDNVFFVCFGQVHAGAMGRCLLELSRMGSGNGSKNLIPVSHDGALRQVIGSLAEPSGQAFAPL